MFRIFQCGRAVLHRSTSVTNIYSLFMPTISKYSLKDALYCVSVRTKVHYNKPKFVLYNLNPNISAPYLDSFTKKVHDVEGSLNPILREKVSEMMTSWKFDAVEKQIFRELKTGSIDMDMVFWIVRRMLSKAYIPEFLISNVLNLAEENFNDVARNQIHATQLMLLAFVCCTKVSKKFLLMMQNYLHTNLHLFQTESIVFFYLAFEKCQWRVTHPLNVSVVDKMLKDMPNLHHKDILHILKSLRVSNYYDKNQLEKIAYSLLENNKILSIITDQHLYGYMQFFVTRHYYNEALYDDILENFNFLINSRKITNIKFSSLILANFGSIQFKPQVQLNVYRGICKKLENLCLNTNTQYKQNQFFKSDWICELIDGMTYFGVFSDELLYQWFSSIKEIPDKNVKRYKYQYIHYTVEIEHPSYNGPTLPPGMLKKIERSMEDQLEYEQKKARSDNYVTVYDMLCDMLGKDYVQWYHILPHFNYSDVEIRLNEDGSVVAFQPETYLQRVATGFESNSPKVKRIVFMHLSDNAILKGSPELKGRNKIKIRQLEKLGYNTLTITTDELRELKTQEEQTEFMTNLIESNFNVKLQTPNEMKQVQENI